MTGSRKAAGSGSLRGINRWQSSIFIRSAQARAAQVKEVYRYDSLSSKLRTQLVQIWREGFGGGAAWNVIVTILRKEYGVFSLTDRPRNDQSELEQFFLKCEVEDFIDVVELSCRALERICAQNGYEDRYYGEADKEAQACLDDINARMKEDAFGFEYANGELIRIDSQFVHAEAVLPALHMLNLDPIYAGAEKEFLKAHHEYKDGDASSTLVECCKSFESIMKAICTKRQWQFDPNKDTAKKLVDICFTHGLIPLYWQSHFTGLRAILESALPTARNRQGGHGSGTAPVVADMELAKYVLHMTAATLLFLAEAEAHLPSTGDKSKSADN